MPALSVYVIIGRLCCASHVHQFAGGADDNGGVLNPRPDRPLVIRVYRQGEVQRDDIRIGDALIEIKAKMA